MDAGNVSSRSWGVRPFSVISLTLPAKHPRYKVPTRYDKRKMRLMWRPLHGNNPAILKPDEPLTCKWRRCIVRTASRQAHYFYYDYKQITHRLFKPQEAAAELWHFSSAVVVVLQTLVIALEVVWYLWGVISLLENYGNSNPAAAKSGVCNEAAHGETAVLPSLAHNLSSAASTVELFKSRGRNLWRAYLSINRWLRSF